MKLFILSLVLFSFVLHAEEPIKLNGHFYTGEKKAGMFKKGNEVTKFELKKSPLIEREKREELFEKAGLRDEVSKMDEIDRDLFYYKVKESNLTEIQKEFPKIDIEKIKKLKEL